MSKLFVIFLLNALTEKSPAVTAATTKIKTMCCQNVPCKYSSSLSRKFS